MRYQLNWIPSKSLIENKSHFLNILGNQSGEFL